MSSTYRRGQIKESPARIFALLVDQMLLKMLLHVRDTCRDLRRDLCRFWRKHTSTCVQKHQKFQTQSRLTWWCMKNQRELRKDLHNVKQMSLRSWWRRGGSFYCDHRPRGRYKYSPSQPTKREKKTNAWQREHQPWAKRGELKGSEVRPLRRPCHAMQWCDNDAYAKSRTRTSTCIRLSENGASTVRILDLGKTMCIEQLITEPRRGALMRSVQLHIAAAQSNLWEAKFRWQTFMWATREAKGRCETASMRVRNTRSGETKGNMESVT